MDGETRMKRLFGGLASLALLAGCGGGSPSGASDGSPSSSPAPMASQVAAASFTQGPGPRFAAGEMLVVLSDAPLRDLLDETAPVVHQLVPGDRMVVLSGPSGYHPGGHDWYEVGHHGIGGWVPTSQDGRPLFALDLPDPNAKVWDLVSFGDSSSPSTDVWALRIEKRAGVEVRISDVWNHGIGGTPADNLRVVKTDAAVRTAIAEAEVIGIELNPGGTKTGDAMGAVCTDNDPNPRDPPPVYTIKDFAEYAALWRQLYDEIFALRDGKPTIVRALDMYVPVTDAWKAAGIEAECRAGWEAFSGTVKQVAAEYRVPVASMYDTFNGPKHDQDPVDKGYIGPDGIHLSELGRTVQVDALDALGYDFVSR